jgi:hypothetical protein
MLYVQVKRLGVIVSSGLLGCDSAPLGKDKPPPPEDEGNIFL